MMILSKLFSAIRGPRVSVSQEPLQTVLVPLIETPDASFLDKIRQSGFRFVAPTAVTAAGMGCAIKAIAAGASSDPSSAAPYVTLAIIADGLDGPVARALNAQSKFGAWTDTTSDFLAYGIAAGTMVYGYGAQSGMPWVGFAAGLGVAGSVGFRLLRFMGRKGTYEECAPDFLGLPSPAGGGLIVSLLASISRTGPVGAALAMGTSAVIGGLMASRVPYDKPPSIMKRLFGKRRTLAAIMLGVGSIISAATLGLAPTVAGLLGAYALLGRHPKKA